MKKKVFLDYDKYKVKRKSEAARKKEAANRYKETVNNFKDNIKTEIEKFPKPLPVDRKTFEAFSKYENVNNKKDKTHLKVKSRFFFI